MTWHCAAIDHSVTIYPHGKIGPCCQIKAEYLKPVEHIARADRFADLKTEYPPDACLKCISDEQQGNPSYRQWFNHWVIDGSGIQFVDIRNTNVCNLKCRYCGPHFSNQWAEELRIMPANKYTSYDAYKNLLFTDDLNWMSFTGGEPLINAEHWQLLETLIVKGLSKNISLQYNTNLTTIRFKDKPIVNLWQQFKKVLLLISVDSTGAVSDAIRSGSDWNRISNNIEVLQKFSLESNKIKLELSPVLSILNLWSIKSLFEYAQEKNINVNPTILTGPDYLALDVVPDELKELAIQTLIEIEPFIDPAKFKSIYYMIDNNVNQCLFDHTVRHVLLLDKLRNENLFDYLPFKQIAIDRTLKNNEYQ
jgi:sulfatase maturation enzyme AslB (radical SAM superfamily)